jgi:predicted DNA-binding transcriptional regulator YafY
MSTTQRHRGGDKRSGAPDGSAIIRAQTSDLWQARQILLRYREHCRVLEPPELIALMRESIERMAELYRTD